MQQGHYSRQTQGALSLNARTLGLFPVILEKRYFKDSSFITGRISIRGTQYDTASFRMPFQQAYNCRFCIHHSLYQDFQSPKNLILSLSDRYNIFTTD